MYPEEIVQPMRAELTSKGFAELKTAEEVKTYMQETTGSTLVVVNSVCGCAAANARPAAIHAIQHTKKPSRLATVFAGQDNEATQAMREHFVPFPPSSPAIALFQGGKLVHMLERHHIEGRPAEMIAENLMAAFDELS